MKAILSFLHETGHTEYCDRVQGPPPEIWLESGRPCTCGFDAALRQANIQEGLLFPGVYFMTCPHDTHSKLVRVEKESQRDCVTCGNPAFWSRKGK